MPQRDQNLSFLADFAASTPGGFACVERAFIRKNPQARKKINGPKKSILFLAKKQAHLIGSDSCQMNFKTQFIFIIVL